MTRTAKLIIAAMAGLIVTLGVFVIIQGHGESTLQRRAAAEQSKEASQEAEISALQNSVAKLLGQVANPVDPLAAYDQICDQYFTNSATGTNQEYYFPCTNSAQTIPQPGN